MSISTRSLLHQWRQLSALRPHLTRSQSTFADLRHELTTRQISPVFEDLTPQTSHRLTLTLADFLPQTSSTPTSYILPSTTSAQPLPLPHHLCYFEPTKPQSAMLADGTNPDQSPGPPFVRRMWAGGRVRYNHANPLRLDGSRGVCAEFIRDVTVKGREGEEKVFVAVERRLAAVSEAEVAGMEAAGRDEQAKRDLEHRVRQRLWRDGEEDYGECSVVETRNIVFLRANDGMAKKGEGEEVKEKPKPKILKPTLTPDYTHSIMPDAKLLFRFSALTFNAHAIHLDPQYCREVEGHRDLLFHGPLSFVFLVTLLQQKLQAVGETIKNIEYRNVAPLYCNESVKFCGTKTGNDKWEVWAQTPEGGIAVKGTAVSEAQ